MRGETRYQTFRRRLRRWWTRTPLDAGSPPDRIGVLFLHTATLPPLGADTWVQSKIIAGLDKDRIDVHVACAFGDGEPTPTYRVMRDIAGIHLVAADLGRERAGLAKRSRVRALVAAMPAVTTFVRLVRHIRRHRIAVIHTTDRPRDAFASVLLARITGVPCIIHAHVAFGPDWMGAMLRWSLRKADTLVGVSSFVAETLVASGHDPARIHVVLNAIDIERWNPGLGRDAARAEFGFATTDTVVITVCRLFRGKGPTALVSALRAVLDEQPDVHLLIVGEETERGYVAELESLADDLGVRDHVIFTGRRSDVPALMAASDIFAMPSLGEPFGLVYLEAMAMELPVIALRSGGVPEVVEDGIDGLLSPYEDGPALVANLLELTGDPDRRHAMGRHGRQRVAEHFTIERMARDTEAVYSLLAFGQATAVKG